MTSSKTPEELSKEIQSLWRWIYCLTGLLIVMLLVNLPLIITITLDIIGTPSAHLPVAIVGVFFVFSVLCCLADRRLDPMGLKTSQ